MGVLEAGERAQSSFGSIRDLDSNQTTKQGLNSGLFPFSHLHTLTR